MKRVKLILCITMFTFWLVPAATYVEAATINEELIKAALQNNDKIAPILESIASLEDLSQGDNTERLKKIADTVLKQHGEGDVLTLLAAGGLANGFEDVLKTKLQQGLAADLGKYQAYGSFVDVLSNTLKGNLINNSVLEAPTNYKKVLNMTATAYAPGVLDNGKWDNLNYMGGIVKHGVVAVDPNVIPMGSKLWVEGYGEAFASDQGSAIKGNRIDLAFENRQDALNYGIKNIKVYVLN